LFFVDASTDRVGLGSSSPAEKLHIEGAGTQAIRIRNSTTGSNASPQSTFVYFYGHQGAGGPEPRASIEAQDRRSSINGGFLNIATAGSSNTLVNALHIDNAQQVGIGTTSPSERLHVDNGVGSGNIRVDGANGTTNGFIAYSGANVCKWQNVNGSSVFDVGGTERGRFDTSGRFLVGTSTARSVSGFGSPGLQLFGDYQQSSALLTNNVNDNTACGLVLSKIRSSSIVQNEDPLGYISFNGYDGATDRAGAYIQANIDGTPGSGDLPTRLVFSTTADGASSPTERLRLTSAGLFQSMPIYDTTGGDAANVVVNSSGTVYRSTSSAKYKTDIETLQDEYADAILELRPVWYRSTCAIDNPDWSYWGFIAEEVAEIDSRLVSWKTSQVTFDDKGSAVQTPCEPEPEGVQYDRFVPHLLNLIKRQKEQIEAQSTAIAALEARLSALEGQ
jgi:hypothetical protein